MPPRLMHFKAPAWPSYLSRDIVAVSSDSAICGMIAAQRCYDTPFALIDPFTWPATESPDVESRGNCQLRPSVAKGRHTRFG
jgi:hypothetical protein